MIETSTRKFFEVIFIKVIVAVTMRVINFFSSNSCFQIGLGRVNKHCSLPCGELPTTSDNNNNNIGQQQEGKEGTEEAVAAFDTNNSLRGNWEIKYYMIRQSRHTSHVGFLDQVCLSA